MDKETAKQVIDRLFACTDSLDGTVHLVKTKCDQETYTAYRDAIAKIMADIAWDVMEKIFKQYPDLRPYELEKETKGDTH